jgi:hypothetical protein
MVINHAETYRCTTGNFTTASQWHNSFCYGFETCLVGDFNGDQVDDIAAVVPGQGYVWVSLS